jgi:hypothetical protein
MPFGVLCYSYRKERSCLAYTFCWFVLRASRKLFVYEDDWLCVFRAFSYSMREAKPNGQSIMGLQLCVVPQSCTVAYFQLASDALGKFGVILRST